VTAMNSLNSKKCFMLFYYQIVTCLLVTWAAAVGGSACRCDCLCCPVKNSFSDVIMNEHLKQKTVNGDTVWGGVSSGDGTRPRAQNRQKLPILGPKILSLKHPDF